MCLRPRLAHAPAATFLLVMIRPGRWWLDHDRLAVVETAANLSFRPDDGIITAVHCVRSRPCRAFVA